MWRCVAFGFNEMGGFRAAAVRWARPLVILGLSLLPATVAAVAAAEHPWPQWRGPTRDGQYTGPRWPDTLGTNVLRATWHVALSPGYGGPVVSADRVFTVETRNKKHEVVLAYDRQTGREQWRTEWEGAMSVPFFAKSNGDWIRATPALDGDRLFVAGMRDVLVCLDTADGAIRWRKDFVRELAAPLPEFGFVSSPLVSGDAVYVQAGASVLKLAKGTGEILWRTSRDGGGMMGSAFSSPLLATLAGRPQLVVQTRERLVGLNLDDGAELWSQPVEAFRGMNILTPVVHEDRLFTSTYGGKTSGFLVSASNGVFSVTPQWTHKAQGYMSTPVVIGGVAYHHLKSQRMMAIELATGRELWTTSESFGKYCSLVAQGDRVLALDQRGLLFLFQAQRDKFALLDRRELSQDETWAHLAVAGDQLFVRELLGLTAYRWSRTGN